MIKNFGVDADLSEAALEDALIELKVKFSEPSEGNKIEPVNVEISVMVHPDNFFEASRVSKFLSGIENVKVYLLTNEGFKFNEWKVIYNGRSVHCEGT